MKTVFVTIGINRDTRQIGIVGFSHSYDEGQRKAAERQGEEGLILEQQETFAIHASLSAKVRTWMRRVVDMPPSEIQEACEGISAAILELMHKSPGG